jgi:RNA polymerase sigma-70 factor (ECF subfamily)
MVDDDAADDRGMDRALAQGEMLGGGMTETDPVVVADRAALRAEIRAALDGIPEAERQVLDLAYYHELTQSEIAARLGWPLGTVKTRTRRALLRLRSALAASLGPEVALLPPQLAELEADVAGEGGADDAR